MEKESALPSSPCAPPCPRVLLTSVCRPLGERHGDAPSVGYELLHGQVTRAQGMFSPRSLNVQFGLDYIAENLDGPVTVLHYPSRREFVRELSRGYDVVGVSFILATFHRMKELVALVRRHAPRSRIVLGGYGTVLPDDLLRPHSDHVCREEGVAFMRKLLGLSVLSMPYRHPLIVSRGTVFGSESSRTGMVFAGLGCPNGCDFCATSHFFRRRHIRLLPTGKDIHDVVARYVALDPAISLAVMDEDFLLNRRRAMEFRDCVLAAGHPLSIFVFSSVKALSQYTVTEILEMGIDGVWIGYEGTRSGYAKQVGRPFADLAREFRDHGILVLASMILGLPYQTPAIIEEELAGLLAHKPALCQFLIYGPTPGTPFYDRIEAEDGWQPDMKADRELYYRNCTGFKAMVKHPTMSGREIEAIQTRCFREEYHRLGPGILRTLEVWLCGHERLRSAASTFLRRKAERLACELRNAYAVFLACRVWAPNALVRAWVRDLEARIHRALGPPTLAERARSWAAVGAAGMTGLALWLGWRQHPKLVRHTYRVAGEHLPSRFWKRLRGDLSAECRAAVELRPEATVWVRLEGTLCAIGADRLAKKLSVALARGRERLVLDLSGPFGTRGSATHALGERLQAFADRIQVLTPHAPGFATLAAAVALYQGGAK